MESTLHLPSLRTTTTASRMATAKAVSYWFATGLIAFVLLSGGLAQVTMYPAVVDGFIALGYPIHFVALLGAWKVLGGLALLAPRMPAVKEWAYAGIFFDFSGAVVVGLVNGSAFHATAPAILIGLLAVSWFLRPASRILPSVSTVNNPSVQGAL